VVLESLASQPLPPGRLSLGMQVQSLDIADGMLLAHDGGEAKLFSLEQGQQQLNAKAAGSFTCECLAMALLKADAVVRTGDMRLELCNAAGAFGVVYGVWQLPCKLAACQPSGVRWSLSCMQGKCSALGMMTCRQRTDAVGCLLQATCARPSSWTLPMASRCCWTAAATCWRRPPPAATCACTS
jgi:hypothetical protein